MAVDLSAAAAAEAGSIGGPSSDRELGGWLANASAATVPPTLRQDLLAAALVPEGSTTCTVSAGAATASVVLTPLAVGGTELSIPPSVTNLDGTLLPVSCVRGGALRLTLPPIRLHAAAACRAAWRGRLGNRHRRCCQIRYSDQWTLLLTAAGSAVPSAGGGGASPFSQRGVGHSACAHAPRHSVGSCPMPSDRHSRRHLQPSERCAAVAGER